MLTQIKIKVFYVMQKNTGKNCKRTEELYIFN